MARPVVQEGVTMLDRKQENIAVDRVIADVRAELTLAGESTYNIPAFDAPQLRALLRALIREMNR